MTFIEAMRHVSTASVLLPAGLSLWRWETLRRDYPTLLAYLWVTVSVEGWGFYQMLQKTTNNVVVFNLYTAVEFGLLSWLFVRPPNKARARFVIGGLNVLFAGFVLYRFAQAPHVLDDFALAFENLLLIVLALVFFYRLLKNLEIINLGRYPMFWFNTGILMFFAGTLFIYTFSNYMLSPRNYPALRGLYSVSHYLNIVFHVALAVGIYHTKLAKGTRTPQPEVLPDPNS
jgi:hypothetical protein